MSADKSLQRLPGSEDPTAEFLSLLAHELRNPLAPIGHAANVLRMLSGDERQGKWLDVIDRHVAHLARLVEELVDGARVQRQQVTLRKQWVDIAEIGREALEAFQPRIDALRQHLVAQLPAGSIRMECDPVRLRQVMDNLLDNAVTHALEGGTVELTIDRQGDALMIRVRDNGVGIAPEAIAHIFNVFSAATFGAETHANRLGVGLAITRSLVELHGGTITAASQGIGRGSTFLVRLPTSTPPPEALVSRFPSMHKTASTRILIVDDNADAAEALCTLLSLEGHVVKQAHTANDALYAVTAFDPAVVLLDIDLPDLSGYEVARRLRARVGHERLRIVALTAFGSARARARGQSAGFDEYLVKPVALDVLERALVLPEKGLEPGNSPER
ncbi:hybrid sensor histidine kinase/response regulator [Pararobbsia alpina]|uniref:histidine kinase n=1 Tax=Pararobbsia alpina TaxID=621374 RepID=A0A6S7BF42_9BURK|nr:ATP-binding protein [Pararobbsia alpina]CAB3796328.1 Aerobic respiration control sensor protein ArcB [Pararobbsia alpina]